MTTRKSHYKEGRREKAINSKGNGRKTVIQKRKGLRSVRRAGSGLGGEDLHARRRRLPLPPPDTLQTLTRIPHLKLMTVATLKFHPHHKFTARDKKEPMQLNFGESRGCAHFMEKDIYKSSGVIPKVSGV